MRFARIKSLVQWMRENDSTIFLGFLCLVIFTFVQSAQGNRVYIIGIQVLFTLLLLSGVGALPENRILKSFAWFLAIVAIIFRWATELNRNNFTNLMALVSTLLFLMLMIAGVLYESFKDGRMNRSRIEYCISGYLLVGLGWAYLYRLLKVAVPGAFVVSNGSSMGLDDAQSYIYFSFVTLTTVGFGDITAVAPIARSAVLMEALIGQLYPAILIGRLVSLPRERAEVHLTTTS